MENFNNLKEVYLNDAHLDEMTAGNAFSFKKIAFKKMTLPTFPKWAVILFAEIKLLAYKIFSSFIISSKDYLIKHPSHAAFTISSILILAITVNEAHKLNLELRYNKLSEDSISNIASLSIFSRNYENQLDNPGAPLWAQKESIKAIIVSARKAGLSIHHQAVLLATAEVESGFNPLARAKTSTACGLFQFINSTGAIYGLNQENCTDPWKNAEAGVRHYKENYERNISKKVFEFKGLEKTFKTFELSYYLHHDGPSSSNPDDSVKAVVLKGTHFLIKSYQELKNEKAKNVNQSEFTNKVVKVILTHLSAIKTAVANYFSSFSFFFSSGTLKQ